jgi:hypothetical protein
MRVPQPRYLLAIKGTPAVCNQTDWRGKPGSPFLGLFSFGDTKESNQLPGCHRRLKKQIYATHCIPYRTI